MRWVFWPGRTHETMKQNSNANPELPCDKGSRYKLTEFSLYLLPLLHGVGGFLASPQTPFSTEGEQPGRLEALWCQKITPWFVYASIGSLALAFYRGELHSGSRLLTWPLDNWISEDMMWSVRIHTHSGGAWWEVILGMHAKQEQRWGAEWDAGRRNARFEISCQSLENPKNRNCKLPKLAAAFLGTVRGAGHLHQPAQHSCVQPSFLASILGGKRKDKYFVLSVTDW